MGSVTATSTPTTATAIYIGLVAVIATGITTTSIDTIVSVTTLATIWLLGCVCYGFYPSLHM